MNIKELRIKQGLSMYDIAIKCDVSYTTARLWDRGVTKPSIENMEKLKKVLCVDKKQ